MSGFGFHQAAREMLEANLVCPGCGEVNIPGNPRTVKVEEGDEDRAGCTRCGRYGRIEAFQPKEKR